MQVSQMILVGDVQGKVCVIVDDMVDTAGTLTLAAKQLIEYGATEVYAACSHGVLSDPALQRINVSHHLAALEISLPLPRKIFVLTETLARLFRPG
jgi:ribose-phosphate pyrophosphokinase